MSDIRRHTPTNERFISDFKRLAGTKTQKGHLNTSSGSVTYDMGILVRIEKKKILQNGWIVTVNDRTYHCTNDSSTLMVPKHTESKEYYVMDERISVDVSLDKENKIYKILRMRLSNEEGVSVVQSNGQLTLLSPSATSLLPFVSSSHETQEETKKKQSKIEGSAIALREKNISLMGDVYINDVNVEETLKKTVKSSSATQVETLNTIISEDTINVEFEHTYSQLPSLNITNESQEQLNYTFTFMQDKDKKYVGATIYFSKPPENEPINILIIGNI